MHFRVFLHLEVEFEDVPTQNGGFCLCKSLEFTYLF